jgi:peptidoglycan/LPS O-acetylase OafA/YrhL
MPSPKSETFTSGHQFPLIDLLRAFAALLILTMHVIGHANWSDFPSYGPLAWIRDGAFGVDLFFVISGFVVTHSAFSLFERLQWGYIWPYASRRLFRIVPLFYLTLAAYLLVDPMLLSNPHGLRDDLIAHMLFYFTFLHDSFSSINGVNWSVGIEMQFYMLIAVAAPLLFRMRSRPMAIAAFVAISAIVACYWRYRASSLMPDDGTAERTYRVFITGTQLPGHLDEFAGGIAIAFFIRSQTFARLRGNVVWCLVLAVPMIPLCYLTITIAHGVICAVFSETMRGLVYTVTFV